MSRYSDIDFTFKRLPSICGFRSRKLVSIEEALEPIVPYINELRYYIKEAKKRCNRSSEHNLTRDESASVYIYTMEWDEDSLYRVLNQALRSENRKDLIKWFSYLKLFDTALDKLPNVKKNVWRGVPLNVGNTFSKNQIVTWWSINSCSLSLSVIKNFLGNSAQSTLFLIEALNGKKISGYTDIESEDEVILRPGTQFRVQDNALDHSGGGSYVVHLVEVDDDDDGEPLSAPMDNMHVTPRPSSSGASSKSFKLFCASWRFVWFDGILEIK